jgi:hypothetical protein
MKAGEKMFHTYIILFHIVCEETVWTTRLCSTSSSPILLYQVSEFVLCAHEPASVFFASSTRAYQPVKTLTLSVLNQG